MAYQPVPPPPPTPPQGTGQRPAARPRSGWVRVVLAVTLVLLVAVAGCTTLVYMGGSRLLDTFRAPVDTANEFLDAARATETAVPEQVCSRSFELARELRRSEGQHLKDVHIVNDRASVSGTVTLDGGRVSPLTVELRKAGGRWCVDSTRFVPPPR